MFERFKDPVLEKELPLIQRLGLGAIGIAMFLTWQHFNVPAAGTAEQAMGHDRVALQASDASNAR